MNIASNRSIFTRRTIIAAAVFFMLLAAADVMLPGHTFFPDEGRFVGEARSLAETGSFVVGERDRAWEMPLTGLAYSVFWMLFDDPANSIRAARVFQALLHILTAAGAAVLARAIFKRRAATAAALIGCALYPSLAAYQAMLLSETLFTCALVWGMALLFLWDGTPRGRRFFAPAVAMLVLTLYVKATITTLMPVLIFARALWIRHGRRSERLLYALGRAAISCALFAIFMAPWWIRNYSIFGEFVPFTTSASMNLYLGNNEHNPNAGVDWSTDVDPEFVVHTNALGDELAISRAYQQKAVSWIKKNKVEFLYRAWLKFKRFWNFRSNYTGGSYGRIFVLYDIALLLSWGIACPLGLASFWLNRRRWRELAPLLLLIAYFTLIHAVVIASLRYRLPIEPFFVVMAADPVARICGKFVRKAV